MRKFTNQNNDYYDPVNNNNNNSINEEEGEEEEEEDFDIDEGNMDDVIVEIKRWRVAAFLLVFGCISLGMILVSQSIYSPSSSDKFQLKNSKIDELNASVKSLLSLTEQIIYSPDITPTPSRTSSLSPTLTFTPTKTPSLSPAAHIVHHVVPITQQANNRPQTNCELRNGQGLIDRIRSSKVNLCSKNNQPIVEFYAVADPTTPELYYGVFRNLSINLNGVEEAGHISDCSSEGPKHDPRFKDITKRMFCECDSSFIQSAIPSQKMLFILPVDQKEIWQCSYPYPSNSNSNSNSFTVSTTGDTLSSSNSMITTNFDYIFNEPVIAIARKDDHNPFFMISSIFNAWLISKVRNIEFNNITLIALDRGNYCKFPIADLFLKLPFKFISMWDDYKDKNVLFRDITYSSSEFNGVLMQGLNQKDWSCDKKGSLVIQFQNFVLSRYGLENLKSDDDKIVISVISRSKKNIHGRTLNRVLKNEDELIQTLRENFQNFYIKKVELESITMEEQIRVFQTTDVIIGMHGAGMANIIFSRPGTTVIEILPRNKRRYSFKRISGHSGLRYYEYRGGLEFPQEDKSVPVERFKCFFQSEESCIRQRKNSAVTNPGSYPDGVDEKCKPAETHNCLMT